jgi:hypothetical protein
MAGGKVIVRDRGLTKIIENMASFDGKAVAVGIQGPEAGAIEHEESDLSNVELGVIHEFGAPAVGIPERSFIRAPFDASVRELTALMGKAARVVYDVRTASEDRVLGLVGEKVVSIFQNAMNRGIPPELKPATVARKGSSKPLIDTAQLKQSITWKIVDG